MATSLPVPLRFAVEEDISITFALVDENGAAVTTPSGTWTLDLRAGARTTSIALTPGASNQLIGSALVAALNDAMPIGVLFTGDLKRVSAGASSVWATVSIVRERVVQDTEDLGARIVQVTRNANVTVSVELSAGSALSQALASAAAAASSASAASSSAGDAATSAGAAASSASAASGSAGAASSSASAASSSAGAASSSAGAASGSATAAATSATNAGNSATAAAGSATASAGARDTALGYLNSTSALALTVAANATAAQAASASATAISASSLSGVARTIASATDVVAVFIYDTAKDSDGGAWRDKVGHTSWMNEALNTATRGSRAQFPSKALLVLRSGASGTDTLTIYDLDDPACPMWMVFVESNTTGATSSALFGTAFTNVTAFGGQIYVGGSGLSVFDLISDQTFLRIVSINYLGSTIANRNTAVALQVIGGTALPNSTINAVAVTVLPHTPRNPLRCDLPNPTIAVGTQVGCGIIRWDGVVCNSSNTAAVQNVGFMADGTLAARQASITYVVNPAAYQVPSWAGLALAVNGIGGIGNAINLRWSQAPAQSITVPLTAARRIVLGNNANGGMFNVLPDLADLSCSLADYKTNLFSTGIMGKNCQLALAEGSGALGSMVGTDALNDDFSSYADTAALQAVWLSGNGGSAALSSGAMVVTSAAATSSGASRSFTTEIGAAYEYVFDLTLGTATNIDVQVSNSQNSGGSVDTSYTLHTTAGTKRIAFVASATTSWFQITPRGVGNTVTIDNVRIRPLVQDRRGLRNSPTGYVPVYPVGTVTRAVVASGAELAEYGPFTSANYFFSPYSSTLDYASGDFDYSLWVTDDGASSVQTILERAHWATGAYSGARITLAKDTNRWQFVATDGTNTATVNSATFTPTAGRRSSLRIGKRGTVFYLSVDDRIVATTAVGSVGSLSNTSAVLTIGRTHPDNATANAYGGKTTLIKSHGAAFLPDMIRYAYEYERQWFQPNAKCLLLGSASVNSLAYDPDADRIVVATPVGTNLIDAKTGLRIGYVQSTLAANKVNSEATYVGTNCTVALSNSGGPANWGLDRNRWSLTENAVNASHNAQNGGPSLLSAATWVYAIPVLAGSRAWVQARVNGGNGPSMYVNLATGATGTVAGTAVALASVDLGGGWWLVQFSFTGTAVNHFAQVYSATANGTNTFTGDNGASGPAIFFGKPMLVQRSTALTAADYQYALSNSDNHTIVSANDNMLAIRTVTGVDLFLPSIGQRERATARRGVASYDPTIGEHRGFTTDATPTDLCAIPVGEGKACQFTAEVLAVQYGGTAGDRARYTVTGEVWRDIGGNVTVRATTTTLAEVTSTMDCVAAINTSAQTLHIRGTGRAATRIAWAVRITQWTDVGLAVSA